MDRRQQKSVLLASEKGFVVQYCLSNGVCGNNQGFLMPFTQNDYEDDPLMQSIERISDNQFLGVINGSIRQVSVPLQVDDNRQLLNNNPVVRAPVLGNNIKWQVFIDRFRRGSRINAVKIIRDKIFVGYDNGGFWVYSISEEKPIRCLTRSVSFVWLKNSSLMKMLWLVLRARNHFFSLCEAGGAWLNTTLIRKYLRWKSMGNLDCRLGGRSWLIKIAEHNE